MSSSSPAAPKGALVFLHGLGDTSLGWSGLEQQLPSIQPRLSNIRYVFPDAPSIPISINGGVTMPGWFDLYDWPVGVGIQEDRKGKLQAVETIEAEVQRLEQEGIPRNKIVVGGFSQGGAIAILAAYHQAAKLKGYAGCVSLSGWLTLSSDLKVPEEAKRTPLFWAHGSYDDKVLFEQQAFGVNKLEEQGVDVEASSYPMGHQSDPNEIRAFAKFLDRVIFDEDGEL